MGRVGTMTLQKIKANIKLNELQAPDGDISIGAHLIKTTDLAIRQHTASMFVLMDDGDSVYKSIMLDDIFPQGSIAFQASGQHLSAPDSDDSSLLLKARDSGVGLVEVARLLGAADPYFGMGNAGGGLRVYHSNKVELQTPLYFPDGSVQSKASFLESLKVEVNFDDASPIAVVTLPEGSLPLAAAVKITTTFDGAAPTLDLGYAANPDAYLENADVNLKVAAWDAFQPELWGVDLLVAQNGFSTYEPIVRTSSVDVIVTLDDDNSTQGVVEVYFYYIKAP